MTELTAEEFADGNRCSDTHIERFTASRFGFRDKQPLVHMLCNLGSDTLAFVAKDDKSCLFQLTVVNVVAVKESAINI